MSEHGASGPGAALCMSVYVCVSVFVYVCVCLCVCVCVQCCFRDHRLVDMMKWIMVNVTRVGKNLIFRILVVILLFQNIKFYI